MHEMSIPRSPRLGARKPAWPVETRRAPPRQCRDARAYGPRATNEFPRPPLPRLPPPLKPNTNPALVLHRQVRKVLMSRRGDLEGVEESFVDNMARGLDAWTSAAGRDLIRWGFMVFQKKVGLML